MRWRSASNPGRFIAVHASDLPSGDHVGLKSYALLSTLRLTALDLPSVAIRNTSVFVVYATSLPPTRAMYASHLPSGDTATSSMPSIGCTGVSVFWPAVTSRTSESDVQTNRCANLPSSH